MDLLEREQQLGLLDDALGRVRASGGVALVSGEAGIGKTSLLRGWAATLGRGVRSLWAECDPLFTPRPLGPLLDVARATGGALQDEVEHDARPHDVAAALLGELEAPAPTVLVLEDLHWADAATLDVARLVARRIAGIPALLVLSYRDDELGRTHPLRVMLGELAGTRGVLRLPLERLSRDAVASLAAAHAVEADALFERTLGNPFFVTESLAAGIDGVPQTVSDAVLARAARLGPEARALLDALAIVPSRAELWLLEAVLGGPAAAIEECMEAGMVTGGPEGVSFRHELARLSVERSLPPDRALALHRRALAALARPPGGRPDVTRLAHHAEACADGEAVLPYATAAAERAIAASAHREAAAQYARALRFADALDEPERAELLTRAADTYSHANQVEEATRAQTAALALYRAAGDRRAEGDALRRLARLRVVGDWSRGAEPLAREAIAILEQLPPGPELAHAYAIMTNIQAVARQDWAATRHWGELALALGTDGPYAEPAAAALDYLGIAEALEGDFATLERAAALATAHGLDERVGWTHIGAMMTALRRWRLDVAADHIEAGSRHAAACDLGTLELYFAAGRARLAFLQGRWSDAADLAVRVLRDPRAVPAPVVWSLVTVGLLRARRGDPEARPPLEQAAEIVRTIGQIEWTVLTAAARAEERWTAGDADAVAELTRDALDGALAVPDPWLAGELVRWRRLAGEDDPAEPAALAEPYRLAPADAAARWRALGYPYEAALAGAAGDAADAQAAIAELQALGARATARAVSRRSRQRGVRRLPRGPHARTRANPAGLTARELEVLALVAVGCPNAEIARRLHLSQKTVGHHVSAILRKLEVPNRSAAGAAAVRLGLADLSV